MDCLFVRSHLFSYSENQLSEKEKNAFTEHLKSCRECSLVYSGVESMNKLIQNKKAGQPNPFIHTRTLQRIASEAEKSAPWYLPLKKRILQPVVISIVLLIAAGSGTVTAWYVHKQATKVFEQQNEIVSIRSGLSIDDFIDEGYLFLTNH